MTRWRTRNLGCGLLGVVCLVVFNHLGAQVGADGHLHEPFALQALGMLLLLGAALSEMAQWLWRGWRWMRRRWA